MTAMVVALVLLAGPGPGGDLRGVGSAPSQLGPSAFADGEALGPDELEREVLADRKRDSQIEALKRIIPRAEDGTAQKAEMLFQLSELYWEKSRSLYRREMLAYFAAQAAAAEAARGGASTPEPRETHRESELYRSETVRLYEAVLREYPSYERKDEVLFNLAYNLYELGQRGPAVRRFEELLRDYPGSKFVPDVFIQLGNHAFEVDNALERARAYYEKARQTPNPRISSYALYKLAWCDFNAGNAEGALSKLQQTVEFAERQGADRAFTDLKSEALGDLVRVFVELDRAEDAVAYFQAHASKAKQVTLVARLAEGLSGAGRHQSAIRTYRALLAEAPLAEAAPQYQEAIIKGFEALRQRDEVRLEVKRLAELYRPGSAWWKANASRPGVLRSGFEVAEGALRTVVTEYHQEAQKTKQVETYRLARDIYRQYLEAFASSDDERFVSDHAFSLKFFYAEILWALEEWEAAARQYDEVAVFRVPGRPEAQALASGRYRQEAAYAAILAYDKLVKVEQGRLAHPDLREGRRVDEAKRKGAVEKAAKLERRSSAQLEAQVLSPHAAALVEACDRFNRLFPGARDEVDIAYQAAMVFYERNHFVEATRRFGDIILAHPEERRSQEAADLSMAVLEEREEWSALLTLARQFLANHRLSRPGSEFARRVAAIVEGSQYKVADEILYRRQKDPRAALAAFLAFVDEFPHSVNADRALTYAMQLSDEGGRLDAAIALGERILRDFPQSALELKVRYHLAKLYERSAQLGPAAAMYESYVVAHDAASAAKDQAGRQALLAQAVDPKDPWLQNAAYNAGLWHAATGALEQAIAAKARYVTRFAAAPDAPAVASQVGLLLEQQGKLAEAIQSTEGVLVAFAKDPRLGDVARLELKHRQLRLEVQRQGAAEVERLARELVAGWSKLGAQERQQAPALRAYAHARFVLLEPSFKSYCALEFKRVATFKADRPAKEKKLSELVEAYAELIKVGNPDYGIAALTRVGQVYADFAARIAELPDPVGLDEEQLAMFRGELESRYVFPVEQKAVEAFEKALAKASELSVYGEWSHLAQESLNRFRPGAYGRARAPVLRAHDAFAAVGLDASVLPSGQDEVPVKGASAGGAQGGGP